MRTPEQKNKQTKPFAVPEMSDEECADRLSEGYRQSFDETCLITWDEMALRLDKLFERKRAQSA